MDKKQLQEQRRRLSSNIENLIEALKPIFEEMDSLSPKKSEIHRSLKPGSLNYVRFHKPSGELTISYDTKDGYSYNITVDKGKIPEDRI